MATITSDPDIEQLEALIRGEMFLESAEALGREIAARGGLVPGYSPRRGIGISNTHAPLTDEEALFLSLYVLDYALPGPGT
jgi:hypothetical protein